MGKICSVNLVGDVSSIPNVDSWLNQAAGEQQAVGLWALKNPTY